VLSYQNTPPQKWLKRRFRRKRNRRNCGTGINGFNIDWGFQTREALLNVPFKIEDGFRLIQELLEHSLAQIVSADWKTLQSPKFMRRASYCNLVGWTRI